MIFTIDAGFPGSDEVQQFYYDNVTSILTNSQGQVYEYPQDSVATPLFEGKAISFSKDNPLKKSRLVTKLKIQLGLSCNYSCDYCSQKFVERADETNKNDIEPFLEKIESLEFDEELGLTIEFWGGEPLVYWKTLKPLAESLLEKFSLWARPPVFSIITNGSLLTEEICAWLYYMGFNVSISHDGPGQYLRGPDPFDDPEKKATILEFYELMRPLNRISFNAMLTVKNSSRKEIHEWFKNLTNDENVMLGEGGFVDAYDEDGVNSSMLLKSEHFAFRQNEFKYIHETDGDIGFENVLRKIDTFIASIMMHKNSDQLVQKCGMDNPKTIAVDLKGNVVTCQNVSSVQISHNGESHLGGNIEDIENVEIKTSTHWTNRKDCANCPVLHICQGSCMFLDGEHWDISCNNAYSDAIVLFCVAFERITGGWIPLHILNDHLPPERQDIWGMNLIHEETPRKKIIPITVVTEKNKTIDDITVYGKAEIKENYNESN